MPPVEELLRHAFVAFTSIFFLVDPFAVVPSFLAFTADLDAPARKRMARKASWTCFLLLIAFQFAGNLIFKVFGITLPAFEIGGGIILMLIGLDMLQARRSTQEGPVEAAEGAEKEDASIIPLGIPMLAGPGTISTVMVLTAQSRSWWQAVIVFAAIFLASLLSYVVLAQADHIRARLGQTGIRILMRLMGLLLTALAIQFMLNGLADAHVIERVKP